MQWVDKHVWKKNYGSNVEIIIKALILEIKMTCMNYKNMCEIKTRNKYRKEVYRFTSFSSVKQKSLIVREAKFRIINNKKFDLVCEIRARKNRTLHQETTVMWWCHTGTKLIKTRTRVYPSKTKHAFTQALLRKKNITKFCPEYSSENSKTKLFKIFGNCWIF